MWQNSPETEMYFPFIFLYLFLVSCNLCGQALWGRHTGAEVQTSFRQKKQNKKKKLCGQQKCWSICTRKLKVAALQGSTSELLSETDRGSSAAETAAQPSQSSALNWGGVGAFVMMMRLCWIWRDEGKTGDKAPALCGGGQTGKSVSARD